MALLTGAVTALALYGAAGQPPTGDFERSVSTSARTFTAAFTRPGLNGVAARPYGAFTGKAQGGEDTKALTDTYVPVLTFSDVSDVDVDITDTYRVSLSMTATADAVRAVLDTYAVRTTYSVGSLVKTGAVTKPATDSYVPVWSMEITQRDVYSATDTYVPVWTMAAAVASSDYLTLTDTYVPVVNFDYSLEQQSGEVSRSVIDSYVVTLDMALTTIVSGEVDDIIINERPYGLIRINEI
jgi:hypothetical protein